MSGVELSSVETGCRDVGSLEVVDDCVKNRNFKAFKICHVDPNGRSVPEWQVRVFEMMSVSHREKESGH